MALDDQIRDVSDALTKRLREEFDAEVRRLIGDQSASLEQERQTAAEEARRQSEAEAAKTLALEVQQVRAEAQQTLAQALATSRTEAEHRLEAEIANVRAESQRALDEERVRRSATDQQMEVEVARVRAEAHETLENQLATSRTEAEHRLEAEIANVRAESQRALDEQRAEHGVTDQQVEREVAKVRAEARETIQKQLAAGRAEAERRLEAEVTRVRAQAEHAYEATLEAARTEAERRLTNEVARARADVGASVASDVDAARRGADERIATEVAGVHAEERRTAQAARQRMRAAVQRLNRASSLSELLDGLVAAVGGEAARAALLLVEGDGFRGWGFDGFGPDVGEARALELAANDSGVVGAALQDTALATWQPGDEGSDAVPRFARLRVRLRRGRRAGQGRRPGRRRRVCGRWRRAEPAGGIRMAGGRRGAGAPRRSLRRVADISPLVPAGGRPSVSGGEAGAPAGREQENHREDAARRYARLLVSEIKLYNEAAVKEGRERRDLVARLRAAIERARRAYEARIAPDLAVRDAVFQEELVRTLANGDAGVLGE